MPPPRTVLVTSAQPKEEKSTIAMSLAKLLAGTGLRVLLLDLDFFRSSSDAGSNTVPPSVGLGQVLEGKADIRDVIHKVNDSGGLAVVSAGTFSTYDVLSVDRLSGLLQRLESDYDTIVLDSPPLLVAAVTQRIATLVDSIICVVRWGHTTREVVTYAVKQLRDCGVNMGGVVLSMVDTRVNSLYFRGDSAYYTGTANHSKGMSNVPHLAVHKGIADYVPAAPSRTEGDRRNRSGFRLAIAAVGVLLAAGAAGAAVEWESGTKWLEAIWQVQRREMLPGGGEANRLPGSLPAGGGVGSYTSPALEQPQEARLIPEEAATGPGRTGTPAVESTAMITQAPSVGSSVLPGSVLRKATDASNALISALEQPTRQSAPTQPAGTPAEKAMPAAWASPDAETLIARGDALLRLSDAAAARLFYARAATLGSASATTAMARTYDPVFLAAAGVSSVRPDARQAIAWYQRAMKMGDAAAESHVIALEQGLQQTSEIDAAEGAAGVDP